MGWECSAYGVKERRIQGLGGGNLTERDHLGRTRCRWVGNITMDLQEMGCGDMDWIELTHDRNR